MKKTKDVSDEDEYSADDPDEVEEEVPSEEEWTPETGGEVSPRHALRFYAQVLVVVVLPCVLQGRPRLARAMDRRRALHQREPVVNRRRPRALRRNTLEVKPLLGLSTDIRPRFRPAAERNSWRSRTHRRRSQRELPRPLTLCRVNTPASALRPVSYTWRSVGGVASVAAFMSRRRGLGSA